MLGPDGLQEHGVFAAQERRLLDAVQKVRHIGGAHAERIVPEVFAVRPAAVRVLDEQFAAVVVVVDAAVEEPQLEVAIVDATASLQDVREEMGDVGRLIEIDDGPMQVVEEGGAVRQLLLLQERRCDWLRRNPDANWLMVGI